MLVEYVIFDIGLPVPGRPAVTSESECSPQCENKVSGAKSLMSSFV